MATGIKVCKICGKEYPYCKTVFNPGVFRWSDVACCEAHGKEYLAKVIASRSEANATDATGDNDVVVAAENISDNNDVVNADAVKTTAKKTRRKKADAEEPTNE